MIQNASKGLKLRLSAGLRVPERSGKTGNQVFVAGTDLKLGTLDAQKKVRERSLRLGCALDNYRNTLLAVIARYS